MTEDHRKALAAVETAKAARIQAKAHAEAVIHELREMRKELIHG